MPWTTPTLREVRSLVRDSVRGSLPGADASVPNSVLRVMSDATGGMAHLTLQYIDWLALQMLPDTAEFEWLDRHGEIWLVNSDSSLGRKGATYSAGTVRFFGAGGTVIPANTELTGPNGIRFETMVELTFASDGVLDIPVRSLDSGARSNLAVGNIISLSAGIEGAGIEGEVLTALVGGADQESDDDLRARVLLRIQQPPMGGDATDYIQWALSFPGVTRAWSYPREMGMGTVTVRFMMDQLRADNDGFPLEEDVDRLAAYLDTVRPVAVKDFFVEAPLRYELDMAISELDGDDAGTRAAIENAVVAMLLDRAKPGQTVWHSWVDEAVSGAVGEVSHELNFVTTPMPSPGYLPVLGSISYGDNAIVRISRGTLPGAGNLSANSVVTH